MREDDGAENGHGGRMGPCGIALEMTDGVGGSAIPVRPECTRVSASVPWTRPPDAAQFGVHYTPSSLPPSSVFSRPLKAPEAPMTLAPPPDDDDVPDQGELEFITELCEVVAEQAELQPILDWLVHKTTRLLGTEECSIKLISAGSDVAKTIMFDNRRRGLEGGSSTRWTRGTT